MKTTKDYISSTSGSLYMFVWIGIYIFVMSTIFQKAELFYVKIGVSFETLWSSHMFSFSTKIHPFKPNGISYYYQLDRQVRFRLNSRLVVFFNLYYFNRIYC